MKFTKMAAAERFHVPWDEFLQKPVERRAEMIAFEIARGIVSGYEWEKQKERAEAEAKKREEEMAADSGSGLRRGGREKTSYWDPMASMRSAMGIQN